MMKSINPATGETLDEFDELTDSELDACLDADDAQGNRLFVIQAILVESML